MMTQASTETVAGDQPVQSKRQCGESTHTVVRQMVSIAIDLSGLGLLFAVLILAKKTSAGTGSKAGMEILSMVHRSLPGAGQKALQPLVGKWRIHESLYVATGAADRPVVSDDLVAYREWIGDGRFLSERTNGTLGGKPYYRSGFLGFNNMDKRYEWVTADNFTPMLMSYAASKGSGIQNPIVMRGSFTDLGITGEENVGKTIPMRTVISIDGNNRHTFYIYFTPPGGKELLADRKVYTRTR